MAAYVNTTQFKRRKTENYEPVFSASVSTTAQDITVPVSILSSQTPQDLAFAVITNEKPLYTKQELLLIIAKLNKMLNPQFERECTYIS